MLEGYDGFQSASPPPARFQGLVLQEFEMPDRDGQSQLSWWLSARHLDQSHERGLGTARGVEAEVFDHGRRIYRLQSERAKLREGEVCGLELVGPLDIREEPSGASLHCGLLTWQPVERRLFVRGEVTGRLKGFFLAAPAVEVVRGGGGQLQPHEVFEREPGMWTGRVTVKGPARATVGLTLPRDLAPQRGLQALTKDSRGTGETAKIERSMGRWQQGQRQWSRKERGRQKLRGGGSGEEKDRTGLIGSSLLFSILWFKAVTTTWRSLRRVLGLPRHSVSPAGTDENMNRHPLWVTRKSVALPLGQWRGGRPGRLATELQKVRGEGRERNIPDGRTVQLDVSSENGFQWRGPQGKVTFCGPLSLRCASLGAQIEAGEGELDLDSGHIRLVNDVHGTFRGLRFTAPELRWMDPSFRWRVGGPGRMQLSSSRGTFPQLQQGLIADQGLSIWEL